MKNIVIDREYGSGGREIARILARQLNIDFYDGDLLELAGERCGIDLSTMKYYDEKGTGSLLHDLALISGVMHGNDDYMKPFQVFEALSRLVRELVREKPCIFLGRCADEILKDTAPFVHVFVYASNPQDKVQRAINVDGVAARDVGAYIRRKDMQRKSYRKFFAGKDWDDMRNYDLCLNTSVLGYEKAAQAILAIL